MSEPIKAGLDPVTHLQKLSRRLEVVADECEGRMQLIASLTASLVGAERLSDDIAPETPMDIPLSGDIGMIDSKVCALEQLMVEMRIRLEALMKDLGIPHPEGKGNIANVLKGPEV